MKKELRQAAPAPIDASGPVPDTPPAAMRRRAGRRSLESRIAQIESDLEQFASDTSASINNVLMRLEGLEDGLAELKLRIDALSRDRFAQRGHRQSSDRA
jgi:hypothetical protein